MSDTRCVLTRLTVVLGMHRSGTSAVANLIGRSGCSLPRTLMPPQADNPRGFAESLPLVRFNNALLKRLDRTWSDARPLSRISFEDSKWSELRAEANALLLAQCDDSGSMVFKDPRVCRLLPFWLPIFDAYDTRYVFVVRNPLEIAASLSRRNGSERGHAEALWMAHVFECFAALGARPLMAVRYEDLLVDSVRTAASLSAWLGLGPASATSLVAAELDSGLRHHRATALDVAASVELSVLGRRLYLEVLLPATRDAPWSEAFKELFAHWAGVGYGPDTDEASSGADKP